MDWTNKFSFRTLGLGEQADHCDETANNGVPDDARNPVRSGAKKPTAPVELLHPNITDEIKRRQISLAVHYAAAVRAR